MIGKSVAQLVAEAKAVIENLTPDQVQEEMRHGALVVDLREPAERQADGVIPGSLAAPRGMLEFHADAGSSAHLPELVPGRRVILHCAIGKRSALSVLTLRELGYTNVAHLDGGFAAWVAAGKPVGRV